jgi:hypothetical protein
LTRATSYTCYVWAYNSCGPSSPVTLTKSTNTCCGSSFIISHIAGDVAPVTKTVTYGTVIDIPGETDKCWITSNLGANHQATAVNDATEASAGWYWQFNRKQGYKHDGTIRTPGTWIGNITESSDWIAANDPCIIELGGGWRLPVYDEIYNIDNQGDWSDWSDPWNSGLKLHAAGCLDWNGYLYGRGSDGYYWCSDEDNEYAGLLLWFESTFCNMAFAEKEDGLTVRCIRE